MSNVIEDTSNQHVSLYWGILAESTTSKNQRKLRVYVPALSPFRNGDISDKGSVEKVKLFNVVTQAEEEIEVHMSRTILTEYLGSQSGYDVPDMYKGQQVVVMNYANTDKWFWIPLERDDNIKTFEHIKLRCANEAHVHKVLTDDNTYYIEIDTKYDKKIKISTASSDGEKYRYFFQIDPTDHTVEIWDTLSANPSAPHNTIRIESDPTYSTGQIIPGRITLQNEAGSTVLLQGPDVVINAIRDLTLISGRNTVVQANGDMSVQVQNDTHILILKNLYKRVAGFIKKQVDGVYQYLFGSMRMEDVVGMYTLNCQTHWQINAASRATYITGVDSLTVDDDISTICNAKISTNCANVITITAKELISFGSKAMSTSAHIAGCCGCPGH